MSISLIEKVKNLPTKPGIYIFKDSGKAILYIGKAASLRSRVGSYFKKNLAYERPVEFVMERVVDVEVQQTDSVVEAFFLEQELIKKLQPPYNVLGKDDKSFVYLGVTDETFPRFAIYRRTDLVKNPKKENEFLKRAISGERLLRIYGPFSSKISLLEALKVLRKIFPYHSGKEKTEKGCLDFQLGLCPGPYEGKISKASYRKNIYAIERVIRGQKKELVNRLEREMEKAAQVFDFEKAAQLRNQLFALKHIQDLALVRSGKKQAEKNDFKDGFFRVEGYDISNISGKFAVGSMVVFDNGDGTLKANKSQYRKFKIKTIHGADDVGSLKEVIRRRFSHSWKQPSLLLIDGGQGQVNAVKDELKSLNLKIPILGVAKGPTRKKLDLRLVFDDQTRAEETRRLERFIKKEGLIRQIRDEAHRFAITYHRQLRERMP